MCAGIIHNFRFSQNVSYYYQLPKGSWYNTATWVTSTDFVKCFEIIHILLLHKMCHMLYKYQEHNCGWYTLKWVTSTVLQNNISLCWKYTIITFSIQFAVYSIICIKWIIYCTTTSWASVVATILQYEWKAPPYQNAFLCTNHTHITFGTKCVIHCTSTKCANVVDTIFRKDTHTVSRNFT